MSGSRQPPQQHPPAGQGAAASAVTSASSSSAPGSCSSSAGLGGPARPVLVAAAVSGSGAAASGLSRLAGAARPGGSGGGSSSGGGVGSRKRPLLTPLCNGLLNSYEDKSNDFVCPICFDMIEEAYMTKCGHSFCYKCIHQSLEDNNRCPKCNYVVDNIDHLYPNFLVNELILKQKQRFEEKRFKLDHSEFVLLSIDSTLMRETPLGSSMIQMTIMETYCHECIPKILMFTFWQQIKIPTRHLYTNELYVCLLSLI